MKIYFAGSIRGGREDEEVYSEIIKLLLTHGEVLTEHIVGGKYDSTKQDLTETEIYNRDVGMINSSDLVVAEVTTPSIGVGYEIAYAEAKEKKIICLYRNVEGKKKISAMISGDKNLMVKEYQQVEELEPFFRENV
ncbi:MAG: nucleoside 2-deoxyribosyltransferase [bacterium]